MPARLRPGTLDRRWSVSRNCAGAMPHPPGAPATARPLPPATHFASTPPPPTFDRPPSLSAPLAPAREDCHAGTRPKMTPVSSDATSVKSITVPSIETSATRGMPPALSVRIAGIARYARSNPRAPPVQRKHQTLRQHLKHQARASCTQRRTNRHFPLANRGADQQKVRDVRAHNQHDHADGDEERHAAPAGWCPPPARAIPPPRPILSRCCPGTAMPAARRSLSFRHRPGRWSRHGLQARHHADEVRTSRGIGRIDRNGPPELRCAGREVKPFGHDADDRWPACH